VTNKKSSLEELTRRLAAADEKLSAAQQDLSDAIKNKEGDRVIRSCREAVRRQNVRVSNLRTDIRKKQSLWEYSHVTRSRGPTGLSARPSRTAR
jgi:hypothetical protein